MEKEEANLETDAAGEEVIKSTRMATSNCSRDDDDGGDGGVGFGAAWLPRDLVLFKIPAEI